VKWGRPGKEKSEEKSEEKGREKEGKG